MTGIHPNGDAWIVLAVLAVLAVLVLAVLAKRRRSP